MPRASQHAAVAVTPNTLAEKLDDMTLNDETGDPRAEGYMDAVRELRDWVAAQADDPPGNPTAEDQT